MTARDLAATVRSALNRKSPGLQGALDALAALERQAADAQARDDSLCVCGHSMDWHAHGGFRECEHDKDCHCLRFTTAPPDCGCCDPAGAEARAVRAEEALLAQHEVIVAERAVRVRDEKALRRIENSRDYGHAVSIAREALAAAGADTPPANNT